MDLAKSIHAAVDLDETIELEFDSWNLEVASKWIGRIQDEHRERNDDVLKALLTLLLFGQIEINRPGTLSAIIDSGGKVAELLKGKKEPEES